MIFEHLALATVLCRSGVVYVHLYRMGKSVPRIQMSTTNDLLCARAIGMEDLCFHTGFMNPLLTS